MEWHKYPYARIAMALVVGIFFFEDHGNLFPYLVFCGGILGIFFIWIHFNTNLNLRVPWINGLVLLTFAIVMGGVLISATEQNLDANKIPYRYDNTYVIVGKVLSFPVSRSRPKMEILGQRLIIKGHTDTTHIHSKLIVSFDTTENIFDAYMVGNILRLEGRLKDINSSKNPGSFDYKFFLRSRQITQQLTVNGHSHEKIEEGNIPLLAQWAYAAQKNAEQNIRSTFGTSEVASILKAILVGQRIDISEKLQNQFAETGAIHILAVSGLHVAIFISLFIWLWDKIKTTKWWINSIKIISLSVIVAFYVILTGASPSVLRAGIMVVLYIIGKHIFKRSNTYNILSFTLILMLLFDPYSLFLTSLQFSYLALLSILFFQPYISKIIQLDNKIGQYIWNLGSVAISAQVLVFPLTVYYFHKFPMYFVISGIVAIPIAVLLIYIGTAYLTLTYISATLAYGLAILLQKLTSLLILFIEYLHRLPYSVWHEVYFSSLDIVLIYFGIILSMVFIVKQNKKILFTAVMVFSIFFVHYQWTYFKSLHTKALMIYDVYNGYLIDIKIGENWHTFKSHTISDKSERFATENYRIKNNMYIEHQKITYDSICMVHIGDKTHMLRPPKIDLIGFCNPIGVVYLDDNYSIKDTLPLLNLSPQMIVLDQSISRKNTYQWKKICHKMGIVCHAIQFDGPLEIPIN